MPDWEKANCITVGTELFYEEGGQGARDPHEVRSGVCAYCPIQQDCLEHALEEQESHGIWGGTLPRQRLRILRVRMGDPKWKWSQAAAVVDPQTERKPGLCRNGGHEMVGDNVRIDRNGYPTCRECRRKNNQDYRKRQKGYA